MLFLRTKLICRDTANNASLVLIYVMPIGLSSIGWRMYIINASWNIVTFFLIVSRLFTVIDASASLLGRDQRTLARRDR